jgi:hypothetical protein
VCVRHSLTYLIYEKGKPMQELLVKPHVGIGPARLGMTREEIRGVLGEPSHAEEAHERCGIAFPHKDYFYENAFQVSYDDEMKAEFIEVSSNSKFTVIFDGVDIHRSEPDQVIAAIEQHDQPDAEDWEYPLIRLYHGLHLSLYREHSDEDRFDGIGVSTATYR